MRARIFVSVQIAIVAALLVANVASATPPKPTTSLLDAYGNFTVVAASTSGTQSGWVFIQAGAQTGTSDFNLMPPARLCGGCVQYSNRRAGSALISAGVNTSFLGQAGAVVLGTDPGIQVDAWGTNDLIVPQKIHDLSIVNTQTVLPLRCNQADGHEMTGGHVFYVVTAESTDHLAQRTASGSFKFAATNTGATYAHATVGPVDEIQDGTPCVLTIVPGVDTLSQTHHSDAQLTVTTSIQGAVVHASVWGYAHGSSIMLYDQ